MQTTPAPAHPERHPHTAQPVARITSNDLMQDQKEVEIEHGGKIYRLRITQLNKLILTA